MIDFFMPGAIFERVMGNEKIKRKFWGFFWREMLVYMVIVFFIIAILILTIKDIKDTPPLYAVLAVFIMIIPCVTIPVIHFRLLSRMADKEER